MTSPLSRGKWIPSPLRQRSSDFGGEASAIRNKTMADIVEALLGLIFFEFGYNACMKVGCELGIVLEFKGTKNAGGDFIGKNRDLQFVAKTCTGYEKFSRPQLLEEAFTHPSALRTTVSSYQRLEWIGDAVVGLCVREWLFRHYGKELSLKDMVMMEDALVSNETLALLSMKHGLLHFLNHRDQTLPSRIESYFLRVQGGSGLWNTDPPKSASDVVESLLGAVHVDGGFAAGQAAAKRALAPLFAIVDKGRNDFGALLKILKHPKRALQECAGELVDLTSLNEFAFTSTSSTSTPVLCNNRWDCPTNDGINHVSAVTMLDSLLVGVADESHAISRNRACAIMVEALESNPELKQRIAACQSKIASATTSKHPQDDGEAAESDQELSDDAHEL